MNNNAHCKFGPYGGQFIPETLMPAVKELTDNYEKIGKSPEFIKELQSYLQNYVGRPSLLYYAEKLSTKLGGAKIYLKREDLNHTGSHKINNTIAQALLAKKMGKNKLIAETGAGQHGVATATAAALFDMECEVFMGVEDVERQNLNVFRMNLLGAKVTPVSSGSQTLKDATNEALRSWVTNVRDTFYIIGSVVGPHPYPRMVRDFQKIIGEEAKKQLLAAEGKLPHTIIACVGGGSNSIGTFYDFLDDPVQMIGVEAAGEGMDTTAHAASLNKGCPGVLHGAYTYLLQNDDGQIQLAHSVSAGLDYPGVGPEHSYLKDSGRVQYHGISDKEALEAFTLLSQTEGIIPALESAHAIAEAVKVAPQMSADDVLLICLSGRGDKDVEQVSQLLKGAKND